MSDKKERGLADVERKQLSSPAPGGGKQRSSHPNPALQVSISSSTQSPVHDTYAQTERSSAYGLGLETKAPT